MKNVNFKRIKKMVAAVISAVLIFSLASCSLINKKDPEPTEPTTAHTVRVTFPEGSTVSQIAQLLEDNGVCSAEEFMVQANNPLNAEEYGLVISNPEERAFLLEGYVFPDTYEFYRNENASAALSRFLKNTRIKLGEDIEARCDELGYTVDEILVIASIIQEEAGNPAEMGKVSSVIHNRLNSSRFPKLQCDVATVYLRDYVKPYVDEARYNELVDLYNTYNCEGLPAGPITNAGMNAINAALYPEDTDYYYFVTDSDGNYLYAETWKGHLNNCEEAGI